MLPITKYQSEIVSSVNETPVTIINAETGAGKSTQLCQYLSEAGYDVIVTEPRRIAAVTLADRVSEEVGDPEIVGYHTGFEKDIPENSKILFCTDGVQLVKQLTERKPIGGTRNPRVLVIDEAHEWNLNIESLVGWTRKRLNEGWNNKVVIASATLNHDELSRYYGNAKVLNIPGTLFPVTVIERPADEFCDQIRKYVAMGKNVLAFLPGKREIEETIKFIFDIAVSSKYPVKKFQFKINGKMTLTNKGNNVYLKFLEFVNECKSEVNKCNIQEYIEMVDEYFNEIIKELDS